MKQIRLLSFLSIVGLVANLYACKNADNSAVSEIETKNQTYFSLQEYFNEQIEGLQARSPMIHKTVSTNNREGEEQLLKIADWQKELNLFVQADINKAAWEGKYEVDSGLTYIRYKSLDPGMRTQQIQIERDSVKFISGVIIHNKIENMIYSIDETLTYYPDSLYRIERSQEIRIVGRNSYQITGLFERNLD